jgi:hypothetical protein
MFTDNPMTANQWSGVQQLRPSGSGEHPLANYVNGKWLDSAGTAGEYAADAQTANAAADRAAKQGRFNSVFGLLSGMFGGGGGGGVAGFNVPGQGGPARAGGSQVGAQPTISAGPVWNPQQIDQQVNATRAKNDAAAESQMRGIRSSTTGRGFGSNSPLLQALQTGVQNANTATNTEAERAFRQQAAEGNATQMLKGQTAQEQQFASRQDEDIRRRAPYFAQQNALIAALAGLA